MRAYHFAKRTYEEAMKAVNAVKSDRDDDKKLRTELEQYLIEVSHDDFLLVQISKLWTLLCQLEQSKRLHSLSCDQVVLQDYLKRREDVPGSKLSDPIWVVFGYWDHHACLYVYENTQVHSDDESSDGRFSTDSLTHSPPSISHSSRRKQRTFT